MHLIASLQAPCKTRAGTSRDLRNSARSCVGKTTLFVGTGTQKYKQALAVARPCGQHWELNRCMLTVSSHRTCPERLRSSCLKTICIWLCWTLWTWRGLGANSVYYPLWPGSSKVMQNYGAPMENYTVRHTLFRADFKEFGAKSYIHPKP